MEQSAQGSGLPAALKEGTGGKEESANVGGCVQADSASGHGAPDCIVLLILAMALAGHVGLSGIDLHTQSWTDGGTIPSCCTVSICILLAA